MNSNSEDFPVPVSPTRRMVYGPTCSLFFDVLMIPFLRDSTSLENTVRTDALRAGIVETYLIVGTSSSSSKSSSSEFRMPPSSKVFARSSSAESLTGSSEGDPSPEGLYICVNTYP